MSAIKTRIMYLEMKLDGINGDSRIGRVTFSKSGRSVYYRGRRYKTFKGGFKANYYDTETGAEVWITGCKKRGGDRLYSGTIEIDEDVREQYWTEIRNLPDRQKESRIRCSGKYGGKAK
jgi:hypothetical protein